MMRTTIRFNDVEYIADLSNGFDLSISLDPNTFGPNCFYAPAFHAEPVKMGSFIGSVARGGAVNFYNVRLNPHGNGTHTESVGHISADQYPVSDALNRFFFTAELVSVYPTLLDNGDRVITKNTLEAVCQENTEALIIRTLPNTDDKKRQMYSGNNPPYFSEEAMEFIVARGVQHLLVDLPSVDREEDDGMLTCHKVFWEVFDVRALHKTITELIFVNNSIKDGLYLLNLQVANMKIDASPSRPVIFPLNTLE